MEIVKTKAAMAMLEGSAGLSAFYRTAQQSHWWWSSEVALRSLAALWLIACTLVVSVRVTRLLLPRVGIVLRWASVFGIGMWLSTVGFHLLRGLGGFTLGWALFCCSAVGAAAVYVLPERAPWRWALKRELRAIGAVIRLFRRGGYVSVAAVFAGFGALLAARSFVVPPLGWDTLTYHGPRAVHWLQTGQFTFAPGPGPYSYYRHFFAGGEIFAAWAMLPFRSDVFVNLAVIVQWLGVGASSWALARAIGVREPFASTAAAVTMFIPTLQLEMNSGYVEPALNAAILHGIALAAYGMRRPSPAVAVVCAMSLGVAAGIKLTGAPLGLVVGAVFALRFLFARGARVWARFLWVGLGGVCAAIPVVPWMWRAWRETGYPLSPMPVKLFGYVLGVASPALQWYQERPGLDTSWENEKQALLTLFSSIGANNEAPGSLALVPIGFALIGLAVLAFRRPLLAFTLAVACTTAVLAHFSDGMTVPRLLWARSVGRYLLAFLAIAIALSLVWCRRGGLLSLCYRRLLLTYPLVYSVLWMAWGWGAWERREIIGTILGLAQVLGIGWWCWKRDRRLGVTVSLGLWMWTSSVVQMRQDETRYLACSDSFAIHWSPRYWADAVSLVDHPNKPERIAMTGGQFQNSDGWFDYFFMGRRFQNTVTYVPPTRDGRIAHFGPHGDFNARADRAAWISRLRKQEITVVLTFEPLSVEQVWMDRSPRDFSKLAGGIEWGLYRRLR